jgi:death-on-curing protein
MSPAPAHLTAGAVKAIHTEVLAAHGRSHGLRDESLLESAVQAPQAAILGEPLFKDRIEMAAAYLFYLCRNHPFADGNRRTALAACLVFLSENGLLPDERLDADAWVVFTLDVAAGRLDRQDTSERLRQLLRRRKVLLP